MNAALVGPRHALHLGNILVDVHANGIATVVGEKHDARHVPRTSA